MMPEHPVVLTGFGIITPRGDATLHQPNAAVSEYSGAGAARLENFDWKNYLSSQKTYLDRASALALAGCALALNDAKIAFPVEAGDGFGITLGTPVGCLDTMKTFYDAVMDKGTRAASPLLFSHSYFNSPISLCAIEFGLGGPHTTFCDEENAALRAIETAFDNIALGHARAMLCGGIETFSETALKLGAPPVSEYSAFAVLQNAGDAEGMALSDELLNEARQYDGLFFLARRLMNVTTM